MKHTNLIGVDVSETSIKVLQLDTNNQVTAYGQAELPIGVIEKGLIINVLEFSKVLNGLLETTKPKILSDENTILRSVLCVPESKLFSYYTTIPDSVGQNEEKNYIFTEASKIIPVEMSSLYGNYHVAVENGVRSATFLGIKKDYLDNYIQAFTQAKVEPAFISGELFAIGRSVLPEPPLAEDCMIVDIGARSTSVGMFSIDAVPNMSILIKQGGRHFTEFLADKLQVSQEDAELKKCEFGVDKRHEETQVPNFLLECLAPTMEKIIKAKVHFEQKTGNPIKYIIISGGSALMPGLDILMAEKIEVDVSVANPFSKIKNYDFLTEGSNAIFLTNVIGLAICANQANFAHINFLSQYLENNVDVSFEVDKGESWVEKFKNNLSIYLKLPKLDKVGLLFFKGSPNIKLWLSIITLFVSVVILLLIVNKYI